MLHISYYRKSYSLLSLNIFTITYYLVFHLDILIAALCPIKCDKNMSVC